MKKMTTLMKAAFIRKYKRLGFGLEEYEKGLMCGKLFNGQLDTGMKFTDLEQAQALPC